MHTLMPIMVHDNANGEAVVTLVLHLQLIKVLCSHLTMAL
jgi:hypothetical protein